MHDGLTEGCLPHARCALFDLSTVSCQIVGKGKLQHCSQLPSLEVHSAPGTSFMASERWKCLPIITENQYRLEAHEFFLCPFLLEYQTQIHQGQPCSSYEADRESIEPWPTLSRDF